MILKNEYLILKPLPDITGIPLQESMTKNRLQVPDTRKDRRMSHRQSVLSQEIDLSGTVANFVDFVKEGRHTRHRYRHNMHTRYRGSWSTSSSPVRSPSPSHEGRVLNETTNGRYGTTSLQQRSRSPSPSHTKSNHFRGEIFKWNCIHFPFILSFFFTSLFFSSFSDYHQNYQLLNARRSRILPATPKKPSILQLPQSDVSFPIPNASYVQTSAQITQTPIFELYFQFYRKRTESIASPTPHSVQPFPQLWNTVFNNQNRRESFDYELDRPPFRDRERELYEQEIQFERELEKERLVSMFIHRLIHFLPY